MSKNTFKAQALAIVMVVLVVASIIGVSLFSRVSKDKDASINEQDSAISSSIVDSTLDFFVGADIVAIEEALDNDDDQIIGITTENDFSEIIDFLESEGIAVNIAPVSNDQWCAGESTIDLTISYEGEDDFIDIQPGSVRVYNLEDAVANEGCTLRVNMEPDGVSVFVVKKVMHDGTNITESVSNYCIGSAIDCSDVADVEYEDVPGSFTVIEDYIEFNLFTEIEADVAEIRILPIKGVLAMNTQINPLNCIVKQLKSIKIIAEANCNDSYRGKLMFTPGSGNLGYSTLFDYGIYDMGLFQP